MIFAQVTPDVSVWAVASGMVTMIFMQVGKWVTDYRKDKREKQESEAKIALEKDKQLTLYRIASAAEDTEKNNVERHGEILLALQGACIVKQNKINKQD